MGGLRLFYFRTRQVKNLTLQNLFAGGGILAIAMLLVQISPIKLDPWSELGKFVKWLLGCIGRAANSAVLAKLEEVTHAQQEAQKKLETLEARLDKHILTDARRDADKHRMEILQFNNTLLRNRKHTKEEFIEILTNIDEYERYCEKDENYPNNRAVLAIENIREVYKERLKKHDFLEDGRQDDGPEEAPEA